MLSDEMPGDSGQSRAGLAGRELEGDGGSRYLVCSELSGHLPSVQKQASG